MAAVNTPAAAELLSRPVTDEDESKRRLAYLLSRSLAAEGIGDELIDALNEVLDRPPLAPTCRKRDDLLARLGLPLPERRLGRPVPLSAGDAARIADLFRRATRQLLQVVPHRVSVYPTERLRFLLALRDERHEPAEALSYLRRYALAILAVLDLMGDDE
ncbi:hypothetical protein ACF1BS_23530 [Streptomyces sp. NPDC014748]|uniref:hypothetical protein n=1 Tax=Streptomyces sp. NPDC014748 TaxID=3364905 RepID=UPI0036FEBDB2